MTSRLVKFMTIDSREYSETNASIGSNMNQDKVKLEVEGSLRIECEIVLQKVKLCDRCLLICFFKFWIILIRKFL